MKLSIRTILLSAVLAVAMVIGGIYGLKWWAYSSTHVSTDDARVKGSVVLVSSKLPGKIKAILADEGDKVRKGDLLVRLDQEDFLSRVSMAEAALESANGDLLSAEADLKLERQIVDGEIAKSKASLSATESKLQEAKTAASFEEDVSTNQIEEAKAKERAARSQLIEAQANFEKANQDLKRAEALHREGIIAEESLESARTSHDQAKARLQTAAEELERAKASYGLAQTSRTKAKLQKEQVRTAQANLVEARTVLNLARARAGKLPVKEQAVEALRSRLKKAEAELAERKIELSYTLVKSPIDGVVSKKASEVGEIVSPGQPILIVHDLDDVWIMANVKETEVRGVASGNGVDIWVDAYPGRLFRGRVLFVGAAAASEFSLIPPENPAGNFTKVTQRVPVKIAVEKTDRPLRPGMMVVVGIEKAEDHGAAK